MDTQDKRQKLNKNKNDQLNLFLCSNTESGQRSIKLWLNLDFLVGLANGVGDVVLVLVIGDECGGDLANGDGDDDSVVDCKGDECGDDLAIGDDDVDDDCDCEGDECGDDLANGDDDGEEYEDELGDGCGDDFLILMGATQPMFFELMNVMLFNDACW